MGGTVSVSEVGIGKGCEGVGIAGEVELCRCGKGEDGMDVASSVEEDE